MKKTYIIPRAEIISIQTEGLLAASLSISNDRADGNSPALSRRKNDLDWEDEDF